MVEIGIGSDDALIDSVNLTEQAVDPATPAAGHAQFYVKGGKAYLKLADGTVLEIGSGAGAIALAEDALLLGDAADTAAVLAKGTVADVLTVLPSGHVGWQAPAAPAGAVGVVGAVVSRAVGQTITTGTDTKVSWDTEGRDDAAFFDAGSPTRLTIPDAGWYTISARVTWVSNSTGARHLWLLLNNTTDLTRQSTMANVSLNPNAQSVTISAYFAQGDYIETLVRQSSGENLATILLSASIVGFLPV